MCCDPDKQLSSAECLEGGFLEMEPKKRKRRGGMVCRGCNFTQRGRCHSITATDTLSVRGKVWGGGLESTSRPPGQHLLLTPKDEL